MNEKTFVVSFEGTEESKDTVCPVSSALKACPQSPRAPFLLFVNGVCFSSLNTQTFVTFLALTYPLCVFVYIGFKSSQVGEVILFVNLNVFTVTL